MSDGFVWCKHVRFFCFAWKSRYFFRWICEFCTGRINLMLVFWNFIGICIYFAAVLMLLRQYWCLLYIFCGGNQWGMRLCDVCMMTVGFSATFNHHFDRGVRPFFVETQNFDKNDPGSSIRQFGTSFVKFVCGCFFHD